MQAVCRAFSRAWAKTGKSMAASIAMMAMTTRSSIRVKPRRAETGRRTERFMVFSLRPNIRVGARPWIRSLFLSRAQRREDLGRGSLCEPQSPFTGTTPDRRPSVDRAVVTRTLNSAPAHRAWIETASHRSAAPAAAGMRCGWCISRRWEPPYSFPLTWTVAVTIGPSTPKRFRVRISSVFVPRDSRQRNSAPVRLRHSAPPLRIR